MVHVKTYTYLQSQTDGCQEIGQTAGGVVSSKPSELFQMLKNGEPNPIVARSAEEYENLLSFVFVKKPFIPRPIKGFLVAEAIKNQDLNNKIF
ncbi:MAG: hypothetical protein KKE12_01855 [Proteobacteria bacterium]|nr:hypothetical protein [Pseudomonadota bacterium]